MSLACHSSTHLTIEPTRVPWRNLARISRTGPPHRAHPTPHPQPPASIACGKREAARSHYGLDAPGLKGQPTSAGNSGAREGRPKGMWRRLPYAKAKAGSLATPASDPASRSRDVPPCP